MEIGRRFNKFSTLSIPWPCHYQLSLEGLDIDSPWKVVFAICFTIAFDAGCIIAVGGR